MTNRDGYNNPAFCNHLDLYDYQYVPEIDPDSPDINNRKSFLVSRQVPPGWDVQVKNNNNGTSSSDDSNGSIIIEERNNRRVTLICEKRPKVMMKDKDGGYVHDISLESIDDDDVKPSYPISIEYSPSSTFYKFSNRDDRKEGKKQVRYINDQDRYEVIPDGENEIPCSRRHRYAEIDECLQTEGVHLSRRKPRASSPENQKSSSKTPNFNIPFNEVPPNYQKTSSPIEYNSFEMSDFSPPRQDFIIQRQPPLGASSSHVSEPMQMHKSHLKSRKDSVNRSPFYANTDKKVLLTPRNNVKIVKSTSKLHEMETGQKPSVRRNISASFDCQSNSSPYRPTTRTVNKRSTAVITPILQRKMNDINDGKSNFQNVSRMFQSTSNVKNVEEKNFQYSSSPQNNFNILPDREVQIKRNKSVPNFQNYNEKCNRSDVRTWRLPDSTIDMRKQPSPIKSPQRFSPLSKSRSSLIDTMKSFSSQMEDWAPLPSPCLILSAVVQLVAGIIGSLVCFYLLSKLGRRYYLDSGTIACFVSIILGVLGFRSQRWKWLPNRNYVSGYVVLGAFSVLNAVALILIVSIRPMSGDPIMDICAGAICAVSVIIIFLSLTGLTMSGCCKSPPPDNRVMSA